MINITESAQTYLADLLAKQDDNEGIGIRVFVSQAGTPQAETCIAYCRPGEEKPTDVRKEYSGLLAYFDAASEPYLDEAVVDFAEDRMGGQLTIKAPHSKVPHINPDSPLEDRINHILYTEINPQLASHGGQVSLVEIVDEKVAVLQFGGGCQGCGMVDTTLKDGVEKTLLEKVPELDAVKDVTDHTVTDNAFYK